MPPASTPEYIHRPNPRSRSLRLTVDHQGQVILTSPPLVPKFILNKFVTANQAWIEKTRARLQRTDVPITSTTVAVFGQTYQKVIQPAQLRSQVTVQGEHVVIDSLSEKPSATAISAQLERFLKHTAEKYILPRTYQLAERVGVTVNGITIRQQKSRWGSCSSTGHLNFNWKLVHYAPAIIDYVIIHELAHRRQMNHSAQFWAVVAQHDPQYQEHRQWLKRHGLTVG